MGDEANIEKVAKAIGLQYRYDERNDQFAHPAVLMLVKPNGEMARYLYGLEFAEQRRPTRFARGLPGTQPSPPSRRPSSIATCTIPSGAKYVLVAPKRHEARGSGHGAWRFGIFPDGVMWRREARSHALLPRRRPPSVSPAEYPASA